MTGDQPQIGVFVGVDMGKEGHWAQALAPDGETLFEGPVGNDPAELEALLDRAAAAAGNSRVLVVVDMISSGAVLLLTAAERRGAPVAYVTGLRMRRAAQLYEGTAKTDPKDAWVLADYARRNLDRLRLVEATDQQLVRMRTLNGHDEDLAADQTRLINRLRDALLSNCPALERAIGNRLTSPGILDLLRKYPTIGQLRQAGRARIRTVVHKRSPRLSDKAAPLIWEAVKSQPIDLPASQAWARIIPNLANYLDQIVTHRKQIEKDLRQELRTHPLGQVLVTIPGFATRTTTRTLTEIGDPHRFANRGQTRLLRRPRPHPTPLRAIPQHHHPQPSRQQTPQKRHAPSRLRRHPKRPPRRTLPNQTRPRQNPPHRPHRRRPPPLRHHPHHPQNPNPLQPPTPTQHNLTNRQEHPPTDPHPDGGCFVSNRKCNSLDRPPTACCRVAGGR